VLSFPAIGVRIDVISHVFQAALNPIQLDDRQVNAVAARIELDLRLGASFTRLQTLSLQTMGGPLEELMISYGMYSSF
jgi:DNA topoisomerase-3